MSQPDKNAHGYLGLTASIGAQLDDFLPGRSVLIKELSVDESAIRVRYETRPPIVERPTPPTSRWLLAGTDDLGNEYESAGGAFGLSPDSEFTDGVQSLEPTPRAGASYIDVGFIGPHSGHDEPPQHVIRVWLT